LKLKKITNILVGHPFRGKIPEVTDSNIMVIQMRNISVETGVDWATCIKTEISSKWGFKQLKQGDILFVARGENNIAVIIDNIPQGKLIVAAPQFFIIRVIKEEILPEFLAWLINQKPIQQYFQQRKEGSMTKSIRRQVIEETPIIIPLLQKQQMIIKLSSILQKEKNILKQLISNGEITMNAIANDLFASNNPNK